MALPRDRRALRRLVPLVRRLDAEPVDGERPGRYRRRMFDRLRRKLPENHDLPDVRADELPAGQAFVNFEKLRMVGSAQAHDLAIDRGGGFDAGAMLPRLVISGALESLRLCSALHGPPPSGFDLQSACANALSFGAAFGAGTCK